MKTTSTQGSKVFSRKTERTHQPPLRCTADTQSSWSKQSWGAGAGMRSKYSTSTVTSLDTERSCRWSDNTTRKASPHTRKSKSISRNCFSGSSPIRVNKHTKRSYKWTGLTLSPHKCSKFCEIKIQIMKIFQNYTKVEYLHIIYHLQKILQTKITKQEENSTLVCVAAVMLLCVTNTLPS